MSKHAEAARFSTQKKTRISFCFWISNHKPALTLMLPLKQAR